MMLQNTRDDGGDPAWRAAGNRVENAIMAVTPKLESLAAGRMGYSTRQVGDLVCEAL